MIADGQELIIINSDESRS